MERKYFWRSVYAVAIFVCFAIGLVLVGNRMKAEDVAGRAETLEVQRERVAVTGYIEPALKEVGIGPDEPYWGALYIYSGIDLFPQISGAVLDDVGRTVAYVSIEFEFVDKAVEPERAEVRVRIVKKEIASLMEGEGTLSELVKSARAEGEGGNGELEIKQVVMFSAKEGKGLARAVYSSYFGITNAVVSNAGKLVAGDEWLSNYQSEPIFHSAGARDMDFDRRYRLVGSGDQLYVVHLSERENEMVGLSVWPVPQAGMSREEAIRTARKRWVKAKTPDVMQSLDNNSGSPWTFDETTGCMSAVFSRINFSPTL